MWTSGRGKNSGGTHHGAAGARLCEFQLLEVPGVLPVSIPVLPAEGGGRSHFEIYQRILFFLRIRCALRRS